MPVTRYASSHDLSIAYQVTGDGPRDLVYVPGWISNVEVMWEEPRMARFLERLGTFSRLIVFDKRGTGMSDRVPSESLPTIEERMDDVRAVMDAAGSQSATLFGHSEGGNMCILFAATYPERTDGLILVSCYAKRIPSEDYPWAPSSENRAEEIAEAERTFGDPDALPKWLAPSRMHDETFRNATARYLRLSSSPKAAAHLIEMNTLLDTTKVLPSIHVPTLCIYREYDADVNIEEGRWIASQIEGSKLVELPGGDHILNGDDSNEIADEIEEFITGHRTAAAPERVLATVLFTDIVGSTGIAAEMGDAEWRDLLDRHNAVVQAQVDAFRGRVVGTQGDGVLATFDGPGRAIAAAQSINVALTPLGLEVRSGLHTGEIEILGDDVAGIAVHIGARVSALAGPGEVLVSRTVKDLVVGSQVAFEDKGIHRLKGIPDEWQLYAAV
jgi:pimeloyl-ACP methyl ester carboxylesterase